MSTLQYNLLGLSKCSKPSDAEVKKAYKKLALISHPDKNPGDSAAKANFQAIHDAYEAVLAHIKVTNTSRASEESTPNTPKKKKTETCRHRQEEADTRRRNRWEEEHEVRRRCREVEADVRRRCLESELAARRRYQQVVAESLARERAAREFEDKNASRSAHSEAERVKQKPEHLERMKRMEEWRKGCMSAEELEVEHAKKTREAESKGRLAELERASKDFEDAWTKFCGERLEL